MSWGNGAFLNSELSKPTSFLGLRMWVVIGIGICIGTFIVLNLFLLSLCLTSSRCRTSSTKPKLKSRSQLKHLLSQEDDPTPPVSKEILEIVHHTTPPPSAHSTLPLPPTTVAVNTCKVEHGIVFIDHLRTPLSASSTGTLSEEGPGTDTPFSMGPPEVSHMGWGHRYTLRELEEATAGLAEENVTGEGGYGIVYRGVLPDNTMIAVKNMLNNRCLP